MSYNYYCFKITKQLLRNYLNASPALLTMNEFPNLFVFTSGLANLLCLLSSYEIETERGRRLVILLRGSLTIDLNKC